MLYRERSGEESSGNAGIMSAGAFSIQRLEGSRYGTVELWVLNGGEGGEGRGTRESMARKCRNQCSCFEAIHKLAPEHFSENIDRQEESLLRINPPRMVRGQTAGWNHTVNVRMMLEFLVPGVKDAEESDFRAETLGIAGDLKQRLGAGPE